MRKRLKIYITILALKKKVIKFVALKFINKNKILNIKLLFFYFLYFILKKKLFLLQYIKS